MPTESTKSSADERTADAVEQIARIREAHAEAEAAGTFDPVLDHVAEDLVVAMPGRAPIHGRDEWAAIFNDLMAGAPERDYAIEYTSAETLVSGDLAIDRGTCIDTAIDADGRDIRTEYNYQMIFQRTTDGDWHQTHTIWNKID